MKRFKKKGFWVLYVAIVLAGAFIIVALGIQNQSHRIQDVNAQINSYGSLISSIAPAANVHPGSIIFQAGSFPDYILEDGSNGKTKMRTIMTCSGCTQTMSTCDWQCGPTFSLCGTRTGQGSPLGLLGGIYTSGICTGTDHFTMATCRSSLFGCGGNTTITCSSSLFGCGGGTMSTCGSSLFGSCGGGTMSTCSSSLFGCVGGTISTCGSSLFGCGGGTMSTCGSSLFGCGGGNTLITCSGGIICGGGVGNTIRSCVGTCPTENPPAFPVGYGPSWGEGMPLPGSLVPFPNLSGLPYSPGSMEGFQF